MAEITYSKAQIKACLRSRQLSALEDVGNIADTLNEKAYLVGGAVRDVVMGNAVNDLDVSVEGNARKLVTTLVANRGAQILLQSRFKTWTVELQNTRVDIATARKEHYPAPGVLPTVAASNLREDMRRRDFSINSLALSINLSTFGQLTDVFDGVADISSGTLRINHLRSFEDDPTRAMRAVRYMVRFGFKLEKRTALQLDKDVHLLREMNSSRIVNEIRKWLEEGNCSDVIATAQRLGILEAVEPSFVVPESALNSLRTAQESLSTGRRFAYVAAGLTPGAAEDLIKRLDPPAEWRTLLAGRKDYDDVRPAITVGQLAPSLLHRTLKHLPSDLLRAMRYVESDQFARGNLDTYLQHCIGVSTELNGRDLLKLNIRGAAIGKCLEAILQLKLDGRITDRAGELEFAAQFAEGIAEEHG